MKLFTAAQLRAWDQFTIQHEPISSFDLMNRAVDAMANWMFFAYPEKVFPVYIFVGTGNNGGDGLGLARVLHHAFYDTKVLVCPFTEKYSADFERQKSMLPKDISVSDFTPTLDIPEDALIIDALFGTGLDRPLDGPWLQVIDFINRLPNEKIAIDIPSGLPADALPFGPCVRVHQTFTFQVPKMAFLFPENQDIVGEWMVGDIGLLPEYADKTATQSHIITASDTDLIRKNRPKFSHKGNFGHALLIAGSFGKSGAAVLAARACLRAGAGLLTVHAPLCAHDILQAAIPEAMYSADDTLDKWTNNIDIQRYQALGIGPGIGTAPETVAAFKSLLATANQPLVLDADALNILSEDSTCWRWVPKNTILTPHPKEFERLFGPSTDALARNLLQRQKAQELGVFIVLKGAHTAIAAPDGQCYFNSTGNPGMATGGSGDVLTGILTGLLAQGYAPLHTCILGVYIHGLAGDLAAESKSEAGMIAGDIVDALGAAWLE
jgi:hydroxyethylthiazole kinase-like uncharacterized protein yjeF